MTDHIGPADAPTARAHAEAAASRVRRAAAIHLHARQDRDAAIRHAAAKGVGTRELARGTGLDPAHVHRIIHSEPKDQ